MRRNRFSVLFPLVLALFVFVGCKGKGAQDMSKSTINAEITGKIEVVSMHPSPMTLAKEVAESMKAVSVVLQDNTRVFVAADGDNLKNLKAGDGKTATLSVTNPDGRALNYQGKVYELVTLTQVKEIK